MHIRILVFVYFLTGIFLLSACSGEPQYPYEGITPRGVTTLYVKNPVNQVDRVLDNWKGSESCTIPAGTKYKAVRKIDGKILIGFEIQSAPLGIWWWLHFEYIEAANGCYGYWQI